jgi:hypothetical protein
MNRHDPNYILESKVCTLYLRTHGLRESYIELAQEFDKLGNADMARLMREQVHRLYEILYQLHDFQGPELKPLD